jgi:hypothetical protein
MATATATETGMAMATGMVGRKAELRQLLTERFSTQ